MPSHGARLNDCGVKARLPGPIFLILLLSTLASACGSPSSSATPQIVSVHATSASYPWMDEVYKCAYPSVAVRVSDSASAEINLRLGEAPGLDSPAFQIGSDDLLVIVQPQVAVGSLTLEQVRQVFSGQVTQWKDIGGADVPVQVWRYSQGEDVESIFEGLVMGGQPITSLARLAVSAQAMSDSVGAAPGSIGFLPRRWKTGNTSPVYTIPSLPVLAVAVSPVSSPVRALIACLQSKD